MSLNSFLTGTSTSTTTLPSWYDTAQQNVVNQATSGAAQIPQLQNTVAGQAINNLSGTSNPFFQAQGSLNQIASGATNPWITDASGNVTPDTSTAMGGLFQAQNQQLNQLLPTTIAPAQAGAIGSGNFGSLRGQTAVDTAKANALADLQTKQMAAALQNQQTGVSAASGLGNVGAQGTSTMTTLGQAQQASPLTAVSDLAQILGTVKAPATVTQSNQLSPLQMMGSIGSLVNSAGNAVSSAALPFLNSIAGTSYKSITEALASGLKGLFTSDSSGGKTYYLADGTTTTDQNAWQKSWQDEAAKELAAIQNSGGGTTDTSGGTTDTTTDTTTTDNTDYSGGSGLSGLDTESGGYMSTEE